MPGWPQDASASGSTSETNTCAPQSTKLSAITRPMPLPAPGDGDPQAAEIDGQRDARACDHGCLLPSVGRSVVEAVPRGKGVKCHRAEPAEPRNRAPIGRSGSRQCFSLITTVQKPIELLAWFAQCSRASLGDQQLPVEGKHHDCMSIHFIVTRRYKAM